MGLSSLLELSLIGYAFCLSGTLYCLLLNDKPISACKRQLAPTYVHSFKHAFLLLLIPDQSTAVAKMLLLLLGIIVLHVSVLVLLFISTIVSVSTKSPPDVFLSLGDR